MWYNLSVILSSFSRKGAQKSYKILRRLYECKSERFEADELNQTLEFVDRKTGKKRYLDMKAM